MINTKLNNGVKGLSVLSVLKYYCPEKNTCIDYMHSVLEGVVKNFFNYWFSPNYSCEKFSLKIHKDEIDKRLLNIRPLSFIQYPPRSLKDQANWRAKEYLTFILYYAIPVFHNIMEDDYFNNLIKLISFLEFILDRRIYRNKLSEFYLNLKFKAMKKQL